ncbi:MAG: TIGR02452 family protein, partial [Verrucomicrobia bacterium]|nr:TIGR02452 family protein [Verrucomicrobiota bacterium]
MNSPVILPSLDSPEMALQRRRDLDMPRHQAKALGLSAVVASREGHYLAPGGEAVDWRNAVGAAIAAKVSIRPDTTLPEPPSQSCAETRVQVANETTLGAARRLVEAGLRPLALNFANGIHPGGGFLGGARAQEEVLCRSSALYVTLEGDPMYAAHRERPRPDSTDWAILSPDVPVFRTDDGAAFDSPWLLSFITCAAPYAPALDMQEAAQMLEQRIVRVLDIARAYGYVALVLGA